MSLKKRQTLKRMVKAMIRSADCVNMFAHHDWIDSEVIEIRGVKYTGVWCHCGHMEIIDE